MSGVFNVLRNYGFVIVLGTTYGFFSIAAPSFFGIGNLVDILHVVAPMIVVAGGMALVVMSGKLDISVGSTAYVASSIFALLMREGTVPFPLGVAAAIGAGLVLGAINGLIVVGLRVNSLIATLGTMIAFRGFGLSLTDGGLIEMPNAIKPLGNTMLGPLYFDTAVRPPHPRRHPPRSPADDVRPSAYGHRQQRGRGAAHRHSGRAAHLLDPGSDRRARSARRGHVHDASRRQHGQNRRGHGVLLPSPRSSSAASHCLAAGGISSGPSFSDR